MKKFNSIFFLSLLVLLHYSKALTYLHCQIESIINTGSLYCDCEKQIKDSNDINQASSAQKTIFKERPSENSFTINNPTPRLHHLPTDKLNSPTLFKYSIPAGFMSSIFHPPKA